MSFIRLSVDFEFASHTWWEAGGRELWEGISEGFDGSSVVVEAGIASSWLEQARRIPGWDEGPDYAPHPIAAAPVAEDDDF